MIGASRQPATVRLLCPGCRWVSHRQATLREGFVQTDVERAKAEVGKHFAPHGCCPRCRAELSVVVEGIHP